MGLNPHRATSSIITMRSPSVGSVCKYVCMRELHRILSALLETNTVQQVKHTVTIQLHVHMHVHMSADWTGFTMNSSEFNPIKKNMIQKACRWTKQLIDYNMIIFNRKTR